MALDRDAVIAAARAHLLAPDAVTGGWRGVAVARDGEELVVRFRWRRLPSPLQVRFALDGLEHGPWTGGPLLTPQDWALEVAGRLEQELGSGGIAWLRRQQRDGDVELLLDQPRHDDAGQDREPAYLLSRWSVEAAELASDDGLDPSPALEAAAQDRLLGWWAAYPNNAQGLPYVAQLVLTRDGLDGARLQHLQVGPDLAEPVPDRVLAEMAYLAVLDAAFEGITLVVCDLDHPALRHVPGLLPTGNGSLAWTADGPLPGPPDLEPETIPQLWQSDDDEIGWAQDLLSEDLERLLAYGQQHPEDYGAVRWVGDRLEISFTDPDPHRERVRAAVQHPYSVDVVTAPFADRDLRTVRAAVEAVLEQHPDSWSGLGEADGHLVLDLRPRGLPVAERLWQDHGDAVQITVGGRRYPLDEDAVESEQRGPGPKQTEPWPVGLLARVELDRPSTPTGDVVRGRLILTATTAPVAFESDQPLVGELLDDQGRRMTSLGGFRVGTGWGCQLSPGAHSEVGFTAGTDSARLADGPVVPPGTWQLVVPIPVHRQERNGLRTTQLLAGPFPITLTEPEPDTPAPHVSHNP